MGFESNRGAGKSLDELIAAFRESPFAVFVSERSSAGIFEQVSVQPAELLLLSIADPKLSEAVPDFFGYVNNALRSVSEYHNREGEVVPVYKLQFNMALSMPVTGKRTEYKYRLERGRDYIVSLLYGAATARAMQMLPRLVRDFYMKLKDRPSSYVVRADFSSLAAVQKVRQPRNPLPLRVA